MAPEQTRGEPASAASDVFVLGLIIYELLIGKPAVTGNNILDVFKSIEQFDAAKCVAGFPNHLQGFSTNLWHANRRSDISRWPRLPNDWRDAQTCSESEDLA